MMMGALTLPIVGAAESTPQVIAAALRDRSTIRSLHLVLDTVTDTSFTTAHTHLLDQRRDRLHQAYINLDEELFRGRGPLRDLIVVIEHRDRRAGQRRGWQRAGGRRRRRKRACSSALHAPVHGQYLRLF
jgi:hypothetical protein